MANRINNPFITIGNIPEEYFCDRSQETKKVIRTLTNGNNIVVMSPRRMGKSKLIMHTFRQPEIKDNYLTFYIDLLHTTCLREFTYAFGISVFRKLSTTSQKLLLSLVQSLKSLAGTFGFDAVTGLPTFTLEQGRLIQPEFTLAEILSWLENSEIPCIVCFDEFQRISSYDDNRHGEVEALLRGHIQHLSNTRFVFSGSERHLLIEMFHSNAKPFYNSTDQLDLKAIPEDIYLDFVKKNFLAFGKDIDIEVVKPYYNELEGTTLYLQKLLHEAFIDCEKGEACSSAILSSSFDYMLEDASENYRKLLGTLSERHKETLYAIAREGKAQKIMSAAFIKKHALESSSAVQTSVKKLIDLDIITCVANTYYLSDILFRIFLIRA